MGSFLWKVMLVCLILGGAQWMHTHQDSQITQQAVTYIHAVHVEWSEFTTHLGEYIDKFTNSAHRAIEAVPKPIIDAPKKP